MQVPRFLQNSNAVREEGYQQLLTELFEAVSRQSPSKPHAQFHVSRVAQSAEGAEPSCGPNRF